MTALLHAILACWPIYLMLLVQRVAHMVATTFAARTKGTFDHAIPDELPLTAGQWLAKRIGELRLNVEALVTDKQSDAYRPLDRIIQLSAETHFKSDPAYWATAAHELGHARIRVARPWLGHARMAGTYFAKPLLAVGVALLVGHMLYAIPSGYALGCFIAALATTVFELVDEAAASVLAYRELRTQLAPRDLRAVKWVLLSAYLTYLTFYASCGLLLTQWWIVDGIRTALVAYDFTVAGRIVIGALTLACAASAVLRLVEMFAPNELGKRWSLVSSILRCVPIVLVCVAWNYRSDTMYVWCMIAAMAASSSFWSGIAELLSLIPALAASKFMSRFEGPGIDKTPKYTWSRMRGQKAVRNGNARLERIASYWQRNPLWPDRIRALAVLAYVPLLVALWV